MQVRKGVVAAAGFGTRFLPASKSIPKEMLPLLDKPVIHYAVEEAAASGLDHLVIVTSREKQPMEDYFDRSPALEELLEHKGRSHLLADVLRLAEQVALSFIRQREQLGLGHAVLTARPAVGHEPFATFLPDDVIINAGVPAIGQMIEVFQERDASVIAVEEITPEQTTAYGVIDPEPVAEGLYRVKGMVEKPRPEDAPSNLGIVGRYVFTPEVFDCLERTTPGSGGEIQLTDGIALLTREQPVYAYRFRGQRYDTGNPLGMLKSALTLALGREDAAPAVREWLAGLGFQAMS